MMNTWLDDSSIHSSLYESDGTRSNGYFKRLKKTKEAIIVRLREKLFLPHENIFLLSNSTHCLLNIIYGLNASTISVKIDKRSYKPYQELTLIDHDTVIPLITHISPDTGAISEVDNQWIILDGAQSVGTSCQHFKAIRADILFFPLHKHLAIIPGIGVLCVRDKPDYKEICSVSRISESGTTNLSLLESAYYKLTAEGFNFNIAYFETNIWLYNALKSIDLELITPLEITSPFIVIRGQNNATIPEIKRNGVFSFKFVSDTDLRITCYIGGPSASASINCNLELIQAIREYYEHNI